MSFQERIDELYNNVGGKIKKIARGYFVVMSVLSIIAGVIFPFVALIEELAPFLIAVPLSVIGVVICIAVFYVSSLPIYWAGELLEKVCKIEESHRGVVAVTEEKPKVQQNNEQIERSKALGKDTFKSADAEDTLVTRNLVLSDGIREIEKFQFRGVKDIESCVIPDGVTTIGHGAFYFCKNLRWVLLPGSVTHIEQFAFAKCGALEQIIFRGTPDQWETIQKDDFWNEGTNNCTVEFE